jgi:plastocyanin
VGICVACTGCERGGEQAAEEPRVLELDSARLVLPDSIRLVVIELDRSLPGDLQPAAVEVRAGDIVRFQARDGGAHAIGFEGTGLTAEARRFLEVTGQMRSPPLLAEGNAWVVSFANAPPGDYPYRCATHGAVGRVAVHAR